LRSCGWYSHEASKDVDLLSKEHVTSNKIGQKGNLFWNNQKDLGFFGKITQKDS